MSNAQDALKAFQSTGDTEEVVPSALTPTPSIRLHDAEGKNVGKYIAGKYLGRREADGPNGKLVFLDIRLRDTNQVATVKKGTSYPEVAVKPGDIVSLFASSRLDKAISPLELGTDIIAVYDGMKRVKTKKGMVWAHSYTVNRSKTVTLSEDDKKHIGKSQTSKTTKEEAVKSKAKSEVEAEEALAQLED